MSEPIVFFGSGPVASASLRLLAQEFTIEAVVTKPRPPHHRGDVPVLSTAEELGILVKTAATKHELDELFKSRPFKSQVGVLIDFGIIVSQEVINYFPRGIVNSHFSLLPEWRGADPITFAILSGQAQTGVSLMLLVEAMDEGPILAYAVYDLPEDVTTPKLTHDLINLSYELLKRHLPDHLSGSLQPSPQSITNRAISYSRKLTKEDGVLDWSKPAVELEREIRAFIEWPKSRATLGIKDVIITQAHVVPGNSAGGKPGDIETSLFDDGILMVETADGRLCIDRLKPAGKKEMTGEAFLAGYKNQFLA